MNVLFLSIGDVSFLNMSEHGVYTDLVRKIQENGHDVYVVTCKERRHGAETKLSVEAGIHVLRVKILNITKTNIIEKGISTVSIGRTFKRSINKFFPDVKFDMVLYSTPPITLAGVIQYIKKRDGARTYLLLKDIFPQNAVDIGMMKKTGLKGLLYKYFRSKEKKLYALSDKIGCMSPANVDYVLKNNPDVSNEKVEVCPNCIEPIDMSISDDGRTDIRNKYEIPLDKKVFVYGGNLGKPQGIPFLIECLKSQKNNEQAYFLIVGDGTEYGMLEAYVNEDKPQNVKLMKRLPREDYDHMVAACDVGMIFLDNRFTIPNFPSRLLSYMQAKLPVLCVTDKNTDIGTIAEDNGFGRWCESVDVEAFENNVEAMLSLDLIEMGNRSWEYMSKNYNIDICYEIIAKSTNLSTYIN